jgi:hypothetical protein
MSIFETHKDLHVKLSKDAHISLRTLLFKNGLSMQEFFEEVTQLIHAEDRLTLRIIENLVTKKAEAKLNKIKKERSLSELDQETLYNLLENQSPLANQEEDDE